VRRSALGKISSKTDKQNKVDDPNTFFCTVDASDGCRIVSNHGSIGTGKMAEAQAVSDEGCLFTTSTLQGEHGVSKCAPHEFTRTSFNVPSTVEVQRQTQEPTPLQKPNSGVGSSLESLSKRNPKAATSSTSDNSTPIQCAWQGCTYTVCAARTGDLIRHNRTHTGVKPFVCTWKGCTYASAQGGNLKRHSVVHTGEKPFACAWNGCNHRSSTPNNLKDHVRKHTRPR
jgi:hypothetical protein